MIRDPLEKLDCLAIDTSLLLLIIGYRYQENKRATRIERSRVVDELRGRDDWVSPDNYDHLWALFHEASRRIITQHIVAEAYGLRNRYKQFGRNFVWDNFLTLLNDPGLDEAACSIREICQNDQHKKLLSALGPADAGLLLVAADNQATVVTDDKELFKWAAIRGVPALLLAQLGR